MHADEMADEFDGTLPLNGNALKAIVAITTDLRQLPLHGTTPLQAGPVIIGQERGEFLAAPYVKTKNAGRMQAD